jgi:hypothetical protein
VARTAVVAGTATAVSNRVSRRQTNRWSAQDPSPQEAPPAPPPAAPAPAAPPTDDVFAQLERLGRLRDDGVLTDAEFSAQKAKLLAG